MDQQQFDANIENLLNEFDVQPSLPTAYGTAAVFQPQGQMQANGTPIVVATAPAAAPSTGNTQLNYNASNQSTLSIDPWQGRSLPQQQVQQGYNAWAQYQNTSQTSQNVPSYATDGARFSSAAGSGSMTDAQANSYTQQTTTVPPWQLQSQMQQMEQTLQNIKRQMMNQQSMPGGPITGINQFIPQISEERFGALVGHDPTDYDWRQNWWQGGQEKDPVPKWDGKNPAKSLKPWLKELRLWRHMSTIPEFRQGYALAKSFPADSWLKQCADRVPEEKLLSKDAWRLIMREILAAMKPYRFLKTMVT